MKLSGEFANSGFNFIVMVFVLLINVYFTVRVNNLEM